MSRPRVPTIRRRLLARLLTGTLAVSCGTAGVVYWYLRQEIVEQYDWALRAKARALAGVVASGAADAGPAFPLRADAMPEYHSQPRDTDYFQMWRADRSVLARSPSLGAAELPYPGPAERVAGAEGFADVALPGGRVGRAAWVAFPTPRSAAGAVPGPADMVVVAATSGEEFDETIGHMVLALVAAVVAISAGTLLVVLPAVGAGLRPVRAVAEAAGRVDADTLGYRFDTASLPGELRPIADRLNALLGRLEAAFRRERTFTANVAHELRTPIAELRTSAEVALRWPDDPALSATITGR